MNESTLYRRKKEKKACCGLSCNNIEGRKKEWKASRGLCWRTHLRGSWLKFPWTSGPVPRKTYWRWQTSCHQHGHVEILPHLSTTVVAQRRHLLAVENRLHGRSPPGVWMGDEVRHESVALAEHWSRKCYPSDSQQKKSENGWEMGEKRLVEKERERIELLEQE